MSAKINKKQIFLAIIILTAACLSNSYRVQPKELGPDARFEEKFPDTIGSWSRDVLIENQVVSPILKTPDLDNPYDNVLTRVYTAPEHPPVMLVVAWGRNQQQEIKIHRPELCYTAQGRSIASKKAYALERLMPGRSTGTNAVRMVAKANSFDEAVLYWIRIGNVFSESAFDTRFEIMRQGISGSIPDGVLVRASIIRPTGSITEDDWRYLEEFLRAFVVSAPASGRRILTNYGE